MTNLATHVGSTAEQRPSGTAISFEGTEVTYRELWGRTGAFAAGLADAGVDTGGRVGIHLPNVPQFVVGFHGTLRAGGVVVPMNPQYKSREIEHMLADSGAEVVVTLPKLAPQVAEVRDDTDVHTVVTAGEAVEGTVSFEEFCGDPGYDTVERADDDVACQPYTSGTTGTPKGVLLTHDNLASNAEMADATYPGGIRTDDRQLGVLPLFHIYGMTVVMNATLFGGGAYYPLPAWDAQGALDLVESEELTLMHGVPAMYNDAINQPDAADRDLSSLRLCGVGGSGIPAEVLHTFEELYDVQVFEGYGLTETSPVTHFNTSGDRRVGSIGKTLPGVESTVVDDDFAAVAPVEEGPIDEESEASETPRDDGEAVALDDVTGEVVIHGPNVMEGYHDRPEANGAAFTEVDGKRWFHTGDIGYHDADGYFYIVDREKHTINTAGYNVYPREVEELLFEHEVVADAAVVGVLDDRRGETVKAFIVPEPGGDATPEAIKRYCLDSLAEYKHPREVEFVDELPRTTTGKVRKFELRGE